MKSPPSRVEPVEMRTMDEYMATKRILLGALTGNVLEIGAGKGVNNVLLGAGAHWIGLEPDRRRRKIAGRSGTVLAGAAERIPLADGSIDAVLATIVLCSVTDQDRVLAEVARVLRPGGRFVFFEHVAAPRRTLSRGVQRIAAPWSRRFDHGCDPSRETWRAIEQAPFRAVSLGWFRRRDVIGLVTPYIAGYATA